MITYDNLRKLIVYTPIIGYILFVILTILGVK